MMKKLLLSLAMTAAITPAFAQRDVLAEKPIFTLGDPKTWTADDQSYTFITADLNKLVAVPTNTSNVFLYPENGTLNTAENQALGAQGFYIDLGENTEIGTVSTTWEGAAADSFEIYLTDAIPTPAILSTEPTYTVSGLGQYTENTAVLENGSNGRYLVFQVTKATNWAWGVKIRSISAFAPEDDILTTFKVSPSIVAGTEQVPVNFTLLNQFGLEIPADKVSITVSDNAVYENGYLTITSGKSATFTGVLGGDPLTATVYVASAPQSPAATSIKTPVYTNTVTDYNGSVEFTTAYNGMANNLGELIFENGEVAWQFGNAGCIFFSNKETTGAWNGPITPAESGYRNLCLDVFSGTDTEGYIDFEGVEGLEAGRYSYFTLKGGEWTSVKVDIAGAIKLNNMSIRFSDENKADILLANIYFSPAFVEGDENAPILETPVATATKTTVELTLKATDDLNSEIYYSISDGVKTFNTTGDSGEEITYTISGLEPGTDYSFTVTASDGLNISEPQTVNIATLAMPDAPTPAYKEEEVIAIYSNAYDYTELPTFDAWGSSAVMSTGTTQSKQTVLLLGNYMGQWGGFINLDIDIKGAEGLNIDIFSEEDGSLTIAPVWAGANGDTPNKTVEIKGGEWNTIQLPIIEFGYDKYGTKVIQLAMTNSTLSSFAIDNFFFNGNFSDDNGDDTDSVEAIVIDGDPLVNVYTIQGICLMTDIKASEASSLLPAGLYIINGKKVLLTK